MEHREGIAVFHDWPTQRDLDLCIKTYRDIAYGKYPFPMHRIIPGLNSLMQHSLHVHWSIPAGSNFMGQYWYNGEISLQAGWPEASAAALAHEIGHAVDFLSLTANQRKSLHRVLHERPGQHFRLGETTMDQHLAAETWSGYPNPPGQGDVEYWNRPLEGYGQAFLESFVPQYDNSDYTHGVTSEASKAEIRRITLEGNVQVFTDIPPTHPQFKEINRLRDLGITNGRSNGDGTYRFDPNLTMTRWEMAVFLSRTIDAVEAIDAVDAT